MTCHDMYPELTPEASAVRGRIVVGVDGSPGSLASLRWAAAQAGLTGAGIDAVYVIGPVVPMDYTGAGFAALPQADLDAIQESARNRLREFVCAAAGAYADATRLVVVEDASPGRALVRLSAGASVLVVGAHHHHGLGFLLGSTSGSCVRHARCPVVVVPEQWPAAPRPDADGEGHAVLAAAGADGE